MSLKNPAKRLLAATTVCFPAVIGISTAAADDAFTVIFNGQAALQIGYHHGDLVEGQEIAGSTWGGAFVPSGSCNSAGLSNCGALTNSAGSTVGSAWTMSTNYTRFGFTATGDSSLGDFSARLEGDFNGTGDLFRIRHAYGQVGPILAGQTDSLWNVGHVTVSGWDWNGDPLSPENNVSRRKQLRYSFAGPMNSKIAVALEEPSLNGSAYLLTPVPKFFDITANLQVDVGPANLTVSAIYKPEDETLKSLTGTFGFVKQTDGESIAVATSLKFPVGDVDVGLLGVYSDGGAGLGQVNNTGGEDTAWGYGGTVAGDFSENVSWNLGGSFTTSTVNNYSGRPTNRELERDNLYLTAGVEWHPLPNQTVTGQIVYERVALNAPSLSTPTRKGSAVSYLNYWIYKF